MVISEHCIDDIPKHIYIASVFRYLVKGGMSPFCFAKITSYLAKYLKYYPLSDQP